MVKAKAPEFPGRIIALQVENDADRLDKYLAVKCPEFSRTFLQKLIDQGLVNIDGKAAKRNQKLTTGERIIISVPPPEPTSLVPEEMQLEIVYEDADIIVLNKPAGLTVHPAPGHTAHTLVNALLARYPELAGFGDSLRPGIVHRLDKDTSGLMVVAKSANAQQNLISQFKDRRVTKGYIALVKGKIQPSQGLIEAPIGRHPSNRKKMAIVSKGRQAVTGYKVKEYIGNSSLLEIEIKSGRTHQIRVHLSAIGYPVIGDSTYGIKSPFLKRQFLHAYRLGFYIPSTGEYKEFTTELPPDLQQVLNSLKFPHG